MSEKRNSTDAPGWVPSSFSAHLLDLYELERCELERRLRWMRGAAMVRDVRADEECA